MVYLGFEPRAAGWKAQTNPLSYDSPQLLSSLNKDAHIQMDFRIHPLQMLNSVRSLFIGQVLIIVPDWKNGEVQRPASLICHFRDEAK